MFEELLIIGFAALAFFIGWIKGCEDEGKRIRRAFRSEDYDYKSFHKVLERYENNNKREKRLIKKQRRKKLKKYFQKKQK